MKEKLGYKANSLCNPFFIYIYSFIFVYCLYSLYWSDLYPVISTSTYLFFILSFICSGFLGFYFFKKDMPKFIPVTIVDTSIAKHFYFSVCLSISNFIYSRSIPLIDGINGVKYDIEDHEFGLPSLHVFIVAYTSFIATYILYYYLNVKKKKFLYYYYILLLFPILELSRSYILFILISSIFVYLQYKGKDVYKTLLKVIIGIILFFSIFGYLGNLRSTYEIEKYTDNTDINDLILNVGDASRSFRESPIPKVYFWAYLYISSPLANLQETIDKTNDFSKSKAPLLNFIQRQLLWVTVSKRLEAVTDLKDEHYKQITPPLTAGTTFAEGYTYLGWFGIISMYLYLTIITLFYMLMIKPSNRYYVVGLSVLNTIILLGIFDNMIILTQLSMQLIFPFILRIRLFR